MPFNINYDLQTLKGDIFGGVTAAVVGLPVALAFGVASGLGAIAGIYGAIAVGFFAAVFGGTKSQISGPTGPMAVAMAVVVTTHANTLAEAFTIVIMAGLIQIGLGVLGIGRFVAFTPYSVISGFMSGIGIIIMLLQLLPFMGAPVAMGGPVAAVKALPQVVLQVNFQALAIAVATLAVGVLWPGFLRRYFPPTLAALAAGTALGIFWLTNTPVIGDVPTGLPSFQLPEVTPTILANAVTPALTFALLGSIDSLLTSLVADAMTRTRHNPNSGTDRPGHRKHHRGIHLGAARSGRDPRDGGQHQGRRTQSRFGVHPGGNPAGAGAGSRSVRRSPSHTRP